MDRDKSFINGNNFTPTQGGKMITKMVASVKKENMRDQTSGESVSDWGQSVVGSNGMNACTCTGLKGSQF